jgi:glycosyltransferase involved in cell wall biosynthesis
MASPFFSVIIPCLNEEKFLPNLLEDLNHQTFTDFEVIVVDGNSDDQTVTKAKTFSSPKPQVLTTKIRNVSHQRNLGTTKAKANWFVFMDADNRLPPHFIEGLKYQLSHKQTDAFSTFCKPDTKHPQDQTIALILNVGQYASNLLKKPQALGAMIGVTRQAFNQIGGFKDEVKFREDTVFVQSLTKHNLTFKIFTDPTYTYSFRRFSKEGTLGMLRKVSKLQVKIIKDGYVGDNTEYPMLGGSYYQDKAVKKSFINYKKLSASFTKLTKKQSQSLKALTRFFTDLD